MVDQIEENGLPMLFSSGLRGFSNVILDREFKKSLIRSEAIALRNNRPFKNKTAFDWALRKNISAAARDNKTCW